jgi:NAD(P)H-hydrate repair Nnr-like enzyme with NAD(P)H-hydrate epimerase domain
MLKSTRRNSIRKRNRKRTNAAKSQFQKFNIMKKAGPSVALLFLSVFIYGRFLLKDLICGSNSCLEPSALLVGS